MNNQHHGIINRTSEGKRQPDKLVYMIPVYLVVFSAFFDTHAQMPILAPYATSLGATPFMLGIVIGTYSFFNIIGNFAGGATIDRRGWKLPLLIGLYGVSVVLILYTGAESSASLVLIRALHGFMGGFLVPSALACLTTGNKPDLFHGPRLAYFGASIGLAAITGPLAAGIIANSFGYAAVYYSLALLMIATAICASLFAKQEEMCSHRNHRSLVTFRQIADMPTLKGAFIFAIGTMGATGTLASFLPARAGSLGLNPAQTGMLFATFALMAIIIQVNWPGRLKPLLQNNCRGAILGLFFITLALTLAAMLNTITGLFSALALFGIGFGFSFQGMLGLVIEGSQPAWRGKAIGLFFAVYSLGVALIPPVSGLIWQNLPSVFPFYSAALVALLTIAAGKRILK